MTNITHATALEMRGISKAFGAIPVLVDVNLSVAPGEVHALIGENGAGKSTLMKILAGVYRPDAGEILIDGRPARFSSPADALSRGIAMIYQEFSLAGHLTVAENILLGREPLRFTPLKLINHRRLNECAAEALSGNGFNINPRSRVASLGAADRQLVEITRATLEATRVLVMDEPTSSLTASEVDELFRLIRHLKKKDLAIIYISHRLDELNSIADRATVLRDGRVSFSGRWGEISTGEIIRHMAGREVSDIYPTRRANVSETRLGVEDLCRNGCFSNVTFEARAGEVVGIAGLSGSGRTELLQTIFGVLARDDGRVLLNGTPVEGSNTDVSVARGVGFLTEDRKQSGLCLNLSIAENLTLANVKQLIKRWRLDRGREISATKGFIERLKIRPTNPAATVGRMSGGNQQKVLLARWLFANSKVFLLDEPTRGVDVAARSEIYRAINELVEAGATVLMVSSDVPELLGMADRILVMRRGRIVSELDARTATQEQVVANATLEESSNSESACASAAE